MSETGLRRRRQSPDPSEDILEEQWWDVHADVVDSIWAMPEPLRSAIRRPYLRKATDFFMADTRQRPVEILEVGCGSGWVGQLIAEPGKLHVTGIDLSQRQLEIADEQASRLGLQSCCRYERANLADYIVREQGRFHGVLLHAILHHLSWQEMDKVLAEIVRLGKGARVYIYEPVHLERLPPAPTWLKRCMWLPLRAAQKRAVHYGTVSEKEKIAALQAMCGESQNKNWVLSPKEIVFQEQEFLQWLAKRFKVQRNYLCNYVSVPVAQAACFHPEDQFWREMKNWFLPWAVTVDRLLDTTGLIRRLAEDYVFMGYECTVK